MVNDTVMLVAKTLKYAEPHKAVAAHCRKAKSLKDIDGVNYPVYVNQGLDEKAKSLKDILNTVEVFSNEINKI